MNSPSVHMGAVRVAAQLPVPEWRVASAQKLSWAALRGSAGFPGTHACARTWPTACADPSRRRRGFSAPFRRRRARTRRRPPERQQHPRRSQITLFHRAKSLHSSYWAVGDTVPRSFHDSRLRAAARRLRLSSAELRAGIPFPKEKQVPSSR